MPTLTEMNFVDAKMPTDLDLQLEPENVDLQIGNIKAQDARKAELDGLIQMQVDGEDKRAIAINVSDFHA